jgi:hypothetical protein
MLVLPLALMAIASGILMFSVILMSAGLEVAEAFATRAGIPFSYAYVPSTEALDWFYLPANFISILMVITVTAGLGLILIGKWISKTPGGLVRGIASYLLLYGLLAPLWLMRASADVAIGKRRSWR